MKVVASLMPRQLIAQSNVSVDISLFNEAADFAEAYRIARNYLNIEGSDEPRMIEGVIDSEEEENDLVTAG